MLMIICLSVMVSFLIVLMTDFLKGNEFKMGVFLSGFYVAMTAIYLLVLWGPMEIKYKHRTETAEFKFYEFKGGKDHPTEEYLPGDRMYGYEIPGGTLPNIYINQRIVI